jgi:malate dehydrogenase
VIATVLPDAASACAIANPMPRDPPVTSAVPGACGGGEEVIPVEYRPVTFVAVIGSGAIGGALAHKLALRDRVAEVRLIDPQAGVAQGKALDILQSSPIEGFSTRVVAAQALHSAAGARAIVIADSADGAEHSGEAGLALVRQIAAVESAAPLVFAGSGQRQLIGRSVSELHLSRSRVLGTAPAALESALRALAGIALDASGADVQLRVIGAPPEAAVVGWEEASASGLPLREQLPPHAIAGLTARIPQLWPPGPYALASAAARVVEAIVNGSRRRYSCFVTLDAGPARHAVASMPVEIGPRGIVRILEPALTRQERTMMESAIEMFR